MSMIFKSAAPYFRDPGVGPTSRSIADGLLAEIGALAPAITARAAEIETGRRVPLDLVEALRSIGVFRMLAPQSHGGLELDLPTALEVVGALCRVDGSVGWTVMIGAASALFSPLLPRETYDQIYRDGPDVIGAGSAQPTGKAEMTARGWRVSGRWPFASGCQHADWLMGLCVMTENGKPLPGPAGAEGPPMVRGVALPARDWRIEDTWYVAGLKGTGSHHIALEDVVVTEANLIDLADGVPCVPGPLYQALLHMLPLLHGSVSVGIAEGAVDELVALANTGRQQHRATVAMRQSEIFQAELGRIAAEVRGARAALRAQATSHWRHALAGTLKTEPLLAEGAQTGTWLATTCTRAVDACFALGGGAALYDSSPLQRRLRDLHVAATHAAVHPRNYVSAGRMLLDAAIAA